MMRIHKVLYLLLIPIFLMNIAFNFNGVTCSCSSNHQSLLLQLKSNLKFNPSNSKKLVHWNENITFCQWNGVTCSEGHVTGLDLSQESINGGINDSSCIFSLQYLKTFNLAFNNFNTEFPSGFHKLKNLRHLNLSNAGFVGNVPTLISQLTKLVTLDLSTSPFNELHISDLAMLMHNLSKITELSLDGISLKREDYWSYAISSSLPKLRILSLSNCKLQGPIDSSFGRLHSLSVIDLSKNNLTGPVPKFFGNFENLTKLNLLSNSFTGRFPEKLLHLKRLVFLDISVNPDLNGSLPDFPQNSSLQTLILSNTGLSGQLPNSISNLRQLSWLDLRLNQFNGSISSTLLANLTELVHLDLSYNNFSGKIPAFGMLKKLAYLDLSVNVLTDTIPSNHFEGLINLVDIVLEKNFFRGKIPSPMFMLPSLKHLLLSNNQFEGHLSDVITNGFPSELLELDLSRNNLEGDIPLSIFELKKLRSLMLSYNKFSGQIDLSVIHKLRNLTSFDLSNNNLSVVDTTSTIGSNYFQSFPSLEVLNLASCRLTSFPKFLRNQSSLLFLDLSNNHIGGSIPYWIWSNSSSLALNISHNFLTGWEHYHESNNPRLWSIDVHDNYLQGSLPVLPSFIYFIDFSLNNLSSLIPPNIGDFLAETSLLSLSRNNFHGSIPESLCNASRLGILDLSMNSLTGTIPKCLISGNLKLNVLNLRRNKLTGRINTYPGSCYLESLDLNANFLQGNIPKYLANCSMLQVLDLGNNQINDQFPCWLQNVSALRVLILRSNKLYGSLQCPRINASSWPHLQILDIASNNLSGIIPPTFFKNWKEMMADQGGKKKNLQQDQLQHLVPTHSDNDVYYHDSVTVTSKTTQMELVKILTIFTAIDMSCNRFEGSIPQEIGELKAVYILNFSHNSLTGQIPWSLGSLHLLESLDLSSNKLSGVIPTQLASLTFMSFMNLSYNQLVGRIPTSTQLQSLSEGSFQGNAGLCGPPLTTNCIDQKLQPPPPPSKGNSDSGGFIDWSFLSAELGFVFGLGIIVLPIMFWKRWRVWYWKHVDD